VGLKMVIEFFTENQLIPAASLAVILSLLGISIAASIVARRREPPAD
jgi:hypothetical protein